MGKIVKTILFGIAVDLQILSLVIGCESRIRAQTMLKLVMTTPRTKDMLSNLWVTECLVSQQVL